jgi:hypothetical protein
MCDIKLEVQHGLGAADYEASIEELDVPSRHRAL